MKTSKPTSAYHTPRTYAHGQTYDRVRRIQTDRNRFTAMLAMAALLGCVLVTFAG